MAGMSPLVFGNSGKVAGSMLLDLAVARLTANSVWQVRSPQIEEIGDGE